MVGKPERLRRLVHEVETLYKWIDAQLRQDEAGAGQCRVCGACCNFTAYDHLLFVTPPELFYLTEKLGAENLRQMASGQCPYQQTLKCTVHAHRFAGCRIFCCQGNAGFQSELTEEVLKKLKVICERLSIPYRYADLATALASFSTDIDLSAVGPCPGDRAG
jgi:Fe-S-cluster containining protein